VDGLDESEVWLAVFASQGAAHCEPGHAVFQDFIDPEEVLGDVVKGFDDDDGPASETGGVDAHLRHR